jgi:hypothetical protein
LPASTEASSGRDGSPGAALSARPGFAGLAGAAAGLAAGLVAVADLAAAAGLELVAEGLAAEVDEPPTALAAPSLRAAAAFEASTALCALAASLARPATPGAVGVAGSVPSTGLGRRTRNHTTANSSATIRRTRKGRLILSTPSLSAGRADS